ncbi:glycosyltransferase family 2 protein [Thermodesulfobacteriota bacterium]
MKFSVIICTYNRSEILMDCLGSLLEMDDPGCPFEVLVIDNNSSDGTEERVKHFIRNNSSLDMRFIREEAQGGVFARNRGIEEASGDLIFYLDDDQLIGRGCLAAYRHYYQEAGYHCMGGKILPWFRDEVTLPGWYDKSMQGTLSLLDHGDQVKRVFYPEYPYEGNMIIARFLYDTYGRFHEGLGRKGKNLMSNEGMDLLLRFESAGVPIHYVPDAEILHLVPPERLTRRFFIRRHYAQGMSDVYMFAKDRGAWWAIASLPRRLGELALSPLRFVTRFAFGRPGYFKSLLRIVYTIGYLDMTTRFLLKRCLDSGTSSVDGAV